MSALDADELGTRLNLDRAANSWRGDCPACGYQRGFAVRAGRNGSPRLFCANGCDRGTLAKAIGQRVGIAWQPPSEPCPAVVTTEAARKREMIERLWRGSDHAPGTPVATYAAARRIPDLANSIAIRYRADASHPEVSGRHPAMVAAVVDADGQLVGAHRTYLSPDGRRKADLDPPKASLGPVWGGCVRLDPVAPEMVVGEGIESAASAGVLLGLPALAALSAGNLRLAMSLPPEVRSVVIAADCDLATLPNGQPGRAGQTAAKGAAARWQAEGRRVRIALPDRPGQDFNDVLRDRAHG